MKQEESWFTALMRQDVVSSFTRLVGGGIMAVAYTMGWPALAVSAAVTTGINILQQSTQRKQVEQNVLNLYKDKIGILLGKNPDDLTLEDLQKAGTPKEQGGLGIITLQRQLRYFSRISTAKAVAEITSTALTVGVILAATAIFPGALAFGGRIGILLVSAFATFANRAANAVADTYLNHDSYRSVTKQLLNISGKLKQGSVRPEQVMSVFSSANPEIANTIKARYGDEFPNLTLYQKEQATKDYEPQLRINEITAGLNQGSIKPSLLGFMAYGQASEMFPDYQLYQAIKAQPVSSPVAAPAEAHSVPAQEAQATRHAERILAEKNAPPQARTVH